MKKLVIVLMVMTGCVRTVQVLVPEEDARPLTEAVDLVDRALKDAQSQSRAEHVVHFVVLEGDRIELYHDADGDEKYDPRHDELAPGYPLRLERGLSFRESVQVIVWPSGIVTYGNGRLPIGAEAFELNVDRLKVGDAIIDSPVATAFVDIDEPVCRVRKAVLRIRK